MSKSHINPVSRIIEIRKTLNLSQKEFASKLNITQGALSHIETNRSSLSAEMIVKVCSKFNVNSEWLLFGRSTMFIESILKKAYASPIPSRDRNYVILVRQEAHADYPGNCEDEKYLSDFDKYTIPGFEKGNFRMFQVSGDSMEPTIHENEIVIVEKVENLSSVGDGKLYVVITREGIVIKRVFIHEDGYDAFIMRSDNQKYKSYKLQLKDFIELWEVKAKITSEFLDARQKNIDRFSDLEERISRLEQLQKEEEERKKKE